MDASLWAKLYGQPQAATCGDTRRGMAIRTKAHGDVWEMAPCPPALRRGSTELHRKGKIHVKGQAERWAVCLG